MSKSCYRPRFGTEQVFFGEGWGCSVSFSPSLLFSLPAPYPLPLGSASSWLPGWPKNIKKTMTYFTDLVCVPSAGSSTLWANGSSWWTFWRRRKSCWWVSVNYLACSEKLRALASRCQKWRFVSTQQVAKNLINYPKLTVALPIEKDLQNLWQAKTVNREKNRKRTSGYQVHKVSWREFRTYQCLIFLLHKNMAVIIVSLFVRACACVCVDPWNTSLYTTPRLARQQFLCTFPFLHTQKCSLHLCSRVCVQRTTGSTCCRRRICCRSTS